MKAIIMAGGEGSRLRPLTCGRPKPMVPVLNRPIMSHIVALLNEHGFTNIGVTLQYQPEVIKDYFGNGAEYGVNLRYFVEESPLGTAGSVKNAGGFLDQTFLVISGDALTDLELSKALEFHRKQGAMATLVLTRVECPLEYGVVITSDNGRITQFLEKPGWGEVFSDTVNTGIYVLEPEALDYFAPGEKFDFSKDLFPLLLREKKPLFGLVLPGYWCDVGTLKTKVTIERTVFLRYKG
ncbi:D-glycero-alpha-D-manno-heptose 1-phosphate guanylyltransferase [Pelotomaculum schinkii]|uniref:D-glycero-alpha-D-manno-heptose 1-phosphate guanylyltransferase n=1 Tax=Pelotomaculum schinkii TaxID=78350 RepID=A0A4Y7R7F3_9FIRM|nr:D-glycero-alpha-D-manno-heptose 1-phosphate guanylyltransferase [Pelotomaculum schinkii]